MKLTETVLQKELPNTAEGVFPDMENTFFEEKAEKAYSAGIVTGYADGSFGAGNHIRREEYAAMLYRLVGCRVGGRGNGETTDPG